MSKVIDVDREKLIEIILTKERRKTKATALKIYKQIAADISNLSLTNLVGYLKETKIRNYYNSKKKELPLDMYKITWEVVETQNSTVKPGLKVVFMAMNAEQILWFIKPDKNQFSVVSQLLVGSPEGRFKNFNVVKLRQFDLEKEDKKNIIPGKTCKIITMADILNDPSVLSTKK